MHSLAVLTHSRTLLLFILVFPVEFLAASIESHGSLDEERLAEAFDRLDSDDSGIITVANLKEFLGEDLPEAYLEKVIDEANITHDHTISYEEFLELWDHGAGEMMETTKQNVGSRRVSRAPSFNSEESSDDFSEKSDSVYSMSSSGELQTGSFFFNKNKELSIRNEDAINVESMSASTVDKVLQQHGILPSAESRRLDGIKQQQHQQQLPSMDEILNKKLLVVAREEEENGGSERKTADI